MTLFKLLLVALLAAFGLLVLGGGLPLGVAAGVSIILRLVVSASLIVFFGYAILKLVHLVMSKIK
jgi:hypothetical protein